MLDVVKDAKAHEQKFMLWPRNWTEHDPAVNLSWDVFPFRLDAQGGIPNEPGVYAFLIQPGIAPNLNASYLAYVGKTERSLRTRFGEYLREVVDPAGRPKIQMWLQTYESYVYFTCAKLASPVDVERKLIDALMPPANSDFSAEVGRVLRAFT